jgi:hypothetical protein
MIWQFILDPDNDALEIDDPIGWESMRLVMKRHESWHGVFFEYSAGSLEFVGDAYRYLKDKKTRFGINANVDLLINSKCNESDEFEFFYRGRLNFGKNNESCGAVCSIKMPIENSGCTLIFNNRYNQKVDIGKNIGFNGFSALPQYNYLGFNMTLSAVAIDVSIEGYVGEDVPDVIEVEAEFFVQGKVMFRPTYSDERYNAIKTGQLTPASNFVTNRSSQNIFGPITPQVLYDDNVDCFSGDFDYEIRLKGSYQFDNTSGFGQEIEKLSLQLLTWDGEGNIFDDGALISESIVVGSTVSIDTPGTFDHTFSGTIALTPGIGLYAVLYGEIDVGGMGTTSYNVIFDAETYFNLSANKQCPPTNSEVFMVHETLSRAIEAVTDGCMRVKSEYYGRTDSEPFDFEADGCGSLRVLTNGLKLRLAPNSNYFVSPKDLFDGLNAIDNIGLTIEEDDERPGYNLVRIEDVSYFYRDEEVIKLDHISQGDKNTLEEKHYSKIEGGYEKWEVEEINGLDEIHSPREYRSSINTVDNTLNIRSKLVAGSYPIEVTRQQSFVDTGAADTEYDNDSFIICVKREGSAGFEVEQGNVTDATGLYSPDTVYNWRIRPIYNLMRWFKSLAGMYPNLSDSTSRIDFSSGEGNYRAKGDMISTFCKLEAMPIAEDDSINKLKFANESEATPLWQPEQFKASYPLSLRDYKKIKAKPYGYISFQCGNGDFEKGFIEEIVWDINKGLAEFTLRNKYGN